MKRGIFLITLVCFSFLADAQQYNGFYGKKMYFDLSFCLAKPIRDYSNKTNYYKSSNGRTLSTTRDYINGGASVNLGIALKNNLGLSLNASSFFANIPGLYQTQFYTQSNDEYPIVIELKHERLNIRTFLITPTLHLSSVNSLLPVGFSHELGVGYHSTSIVEKDYVYEATPFSYYDNNTNIYVNNKEDATAFVDSLTNVNGPIIDYNRKFKGLSLCYALKLRRPLTPMLAINAGLLYSFHFTRSNDKQIYSDQYADGGIARNMLNYHRYSIWKFEFGLTYLF